jgi:hypothetical protein
LKNTRIGALVGKGHTLCKKFANVHTIPRRLVFSFSIDFWWRIAKYNKKIGLRRRADGVRWNLEKQDMQTTHEHPIGFGRHDCLPFPPLDCLDEAEIDGGYSVGKYFAIQIGDALVLYSDDGMPTGMSVAEAIAADKMEDAGCDATHVHQFLAEVRHANAESERASRDLADIPTTPEQLGMRAAYAWYINLLKRQGDALAALLASIAAAVKASFSGSADKIEASTAAPPPRAAARIGARSIASITLTPRILSQRPIAARAARAGCLLT